MNARQLPVCVAVLALFPSSGMAQDRPASEKANAALAAPANLTFGTPMGGGASAVQLILDASTKNKVGTAAIGWQTGSGRFQLAFSGPLDDDGATEPVSLTGLSAGATGKLSVNKVSWKGPNIWERERIKEICRIAGLPHDAPSPPADKRCKYENLLKVNPNLAADYRELQHLDDRPWLFGGEITAGQVTQKFLTPRTLVPGSEKDVTWSVAGRAGVFIQAVGFLLGTYTYGETLKPAAPATQVCTPLTDTDVAGAMTCGSHVVGLPISRTASVMALELRHRGAGRVAWSPSVQIDMRRNADGQRTALVEVPIYFLSSGSGASPSGGVRLTWRSDQKELTAVIFIGGAFSLFQ